MTTKAIKIGKIISLANIVKPIVELKKLKFFKSREWGEMGGMSADVWINGIKCMDVIDSGEGGCYDYQSIQTPEAQANIQLLENYLKTTEKYNYNEGMDAYICDLGVKQYEEKAKDRYVKKMQKLMQTAIIFGNDKGYRIYNFNQPLNTVPIQTLNIYYSKAKIMCGKSESVLNTNLKELGIKL